MIKVMFICHGNICRSAMAKYMFRDKLRRLKLEKKIMCDSSATSNEEIGNDMYYVAKDCLQRHKISFDRHCAKRIKQSDVEDFDYLFYMDKENEYGLRHLVKDERHKIKLLGDKEIDDPWYTNRFEEVYEQIDEALDKLIKEIV